jgi:hypothetical protein
MNKSIKEMGLFNLESEKIGYKDIKLKGDPKRKEIVKMMGKDYLTYSNYHICSNSLSDAAAKAILWCKENKYI